ncbi:MAG: DUF1858 domain-containing protein [Aerococcaceae bacterium]|nr:DUF1858 domain-containing protein [Aerococcaceae bacterium]
MDNIIQLDIPVYEVIQAHPEVRDILIEAGFTPLANPMMLNTVGKITSLNQGAKRIRLPLEKLIQLLEWNGYEVKGASQHD